MQCPADSAINVGNINQHITVAKLQKMKVIAIDATSLFARKKLRLIGVVCGIE